MLNSVERKNLIMSSRIININQNDNEINNTIDKYERPINVDIIMVPPFIIAFESVVSFIFGEVSSKLHFLETSISLQYMLLNDSLVQ